MTKKKDRRQYKDQKKKTEDNTKTKRKKKKTEDKTMTNCLFLLVIVLSSVFFFWSLYCLLSFSFSHCIVFFLLVIVLSSVFFFWSLHCQRQYNDQEKKTEDNTMTKRKRQKTIQ
jgi:sensor histidine kinase YesM